MQKALIISLNGKKVEMQFTTLLIKPGQYIGNCKPAQTDPMLRKTVWTE